MSSFEEQQSCVSDDSKVDQKNEDKKSLMMKLLELNNVWFGCTTVKKRTPSRKIPKPDFHRSNEERNNTPNVSNSINHSQTITQNESEISLWIELSRIKIEETKKHITYILKLKIHMESN